MNTGGFLLIFIIETMWFYCVGIYLHTVFMVDMVVIIRSCMYEEQI